MSERQFRPAQGWLFVSEVEKTIVDVGVDLDICRIGNEVEFEQCDPLRIEKLGLLVLKDEAIYLEVEK